MWRNLNSVWSKFLKTVFLWRSKIYNFPAYHKVTPKSCLPLFNLFTTAAHYNKRFVTIAFKAWWWTFDRYSELVATPLKDA